MGSQTEVKDIGKTVCLMPSTTNAIRGHTAHHPWSSVDSRGNGGKPTLYDTSDSPKGTRKITYFPAG